MDIPGPTGALQAELTNSESRHFAVLCHPHPQYGGNMHDRVLDCLAGALLETGISVLRFNFRGVGTSEGVSSGGAAEANDLLAVAAWLKAEHDPESLWLGGYSFGANMVWRTLSVIEPARVLLIAPPVGLMDFAEQPITMAVDIFTGDHDDYVDVDKLSSLSGARVHTIVGADHFYLGYHDQLQQRIRDAIS
jgi:alpha/beta superfamily hydrolase